MEDSAILELYNSRSEQAISETAVKYGGYCYSIAYNILTNHEDAEESVDDTYLAAWNAIPPHCPPILAAFLGKITRHLSIDRWRSRRAYKRTGDELLVALEELGECGDGQGSAEDAALRKELARSVNRFVGNLPQPERSVFLCRYWYMDTVPEIAAHFEFTESKVASMLLRLRKKLRAHLEKEGQL